MTIREMRTRLGNTQSEFAARYNIPFRTIQNWEAGVRNPPEYIVDLLEGRVRADLINRRTTTLPKYDPQKLDLPKRRDYVGAFAWLKAVRESLGDSLGNLLEIKICKLAVTFNNLIHSLSPFQFVDIYIFIFIISLGVDFRHSENPHLILHSDFMAIAIPLHNSTNRIKDTGCHGSAFCILH